MPVALDLAADVLTNVGPRARARCRGLLDDVSELVREQKAPGRRPWLVGTGREQDVGAYRQRPGASGARLGRGALVLVDADVPEVAAEL